MTVIARLMAVCGIVLVGTSVTVGAAFFGLKSWLSWAPLAMGTTLATVGGLLSMRALSGRGSWLRAAMKLALEVVAVMALAVVANIVALKTPMAIDVTASKRNTLAEASLQVARALQVPVHVQATLAADDRAWRELVELVERYRHEISAPGSIVVERVDPGPAGSSSGRDTSVVVSVGDRRHRLRFEAGAPNHEVLLTNAFRRLALEERPRIYVLAGHDEASVSDAGPSGLRRFGEALVEEGAEIVPLPLSALTDVPQDAALIVVAAAQDIPSAMAVLLQRWLEGGGRLLVLLEPQRTSGLESVFGSVGIFVNDDIIRDASAFSGVLGGPETATGVAYAAHPVTAKLGGAMTHFQRARSLSVIPGTSAEPLALVQTSADAFGDMPPTSTSVDVGDVEGPLTVMLAAETLHPGGGRAGRIVVAGDTSFASNQGISLGANQDLALNAALWLMSRDDAIVVRPRGRGGNLLLLSPTARERIAFVLLYGLPVALLCAGLSVAAVRRASSGLAGGERSKQR